MGDARKPATQRDPSTALGRPVPRAAVPSVIHAEQPGAAAALSAAAVFVNVALVEAPAALAADGTGVAAGIAALPHSARALAGAAVADLAERAAGRATTTVLVA